MAPDSTVPAVLNKKATRILGEPQYYAIDSSTRVQIQCEKGDWVRVQLTEPEWLTDVKGWTKRGIYFRLAPLEKPEFSPRRICSGMTIRANTRGS